MQPKVYVMTSDGYLPILRSYAYLFNRYWSDEQEVIVAGYAAPTFDLPPNFSFVSLGDQRNYPVNKWSDGLIKLLKQIDDSHLILMLEDYLITRHVAESSNHSSGRIVTAQVAGRSPVRRATSFR